MRLPGFPVAVPGETLSSVVARHLARSATQKTRNLALLGLRKAAANSLVPRELQTFVDIMPLGHPWIDSPDRIVLNHTLVPLFLHFAHPERSAAAIASICAGETKNPAASLGLTVALSKDLLQADKFCPECVAHDIATRGFPVLYREHQPSYVRFCAAHARPLHSNCVRCRSSLRAASMWRMAGRCHCDQPQTHPVLEAGLDVKTEEAWLWLSQQIATILASSNPIPSTSLAANLFSALSAGGFAATRLGLNPAAMTEALTERFGTVFLREMGVEAWCEPLPGGRKPSRVLTQDVIEGKRIPNVLHALLLARLVVDDISVLWNTFPAPQTIEQRLPIGYGRRENNARQIIGEQAIKSALKATNGKITVAAQMLGVHSYVLAADMLRYGIRLPLPAVTTRRLGAKRINAVRKALRDGIPKSEIEHRLDISEWSIVLIQLDAPELREAHREATVARHRQTHRNALLAFRRKHPSKSRSVFANEHAGAFDWLREYDREWLNAHLPAPSRDGRKQPQKNRKNWPKIDRAAVTVIRAMARDELGKLTRPTRITRTRLLAAAGALAAMGKAGRGRYPKASAEAQRLAERKAEFLRRTIRWSLQEYAKRHVPISTNQLRRVARLPASMLMENRGYIIEVAHELQLPFDARCSLSPWHKSKQHEATPL